MTQNQEKTSLAELIESLPSRTGAIECSGLAGSEKAWLIARLHARGQLPLCVVTATLKEAEQMAGEVDFFLGSRTAALHVFPPYNILPHKMLGYHSQTAARRIGTLFAISESRHPFLLITCVDALLQKLAPKDELNGFAELVMAGEETDRDQLIEKLISGGYTHAALVEEPGDFCVRGGLIDLFSPLYPDPLRLEWFGDTVDAIRTFSPDSQRKTGDLSEAVILSAREVILKKETLPEVITRIRSRAFEQGLGVSRSSETIDRIRNEGLFPGIEGLLPLMYPRLDPLFTYLPKDTLYVLDAISELAASAAKFTERVTENYQGTLQKEHVCVQPDSLYFTWDAVWPKITATNPLVLDAFDILRRSEADSPSSVSSPLQFSVEDNLNLKRAMEKGVDTDHLLQPVAEWINRALERDCTPVIVCRTESQARRIEALLGHYQIAVHFTPQMPVPDSGRRQVYGCIGSLAKGFVWPSEHLALISAQEVFGKSKRRRSRREKKAPTALLTFEDLKKEDLVVHAQHGIGRYQGLETLKFEGVTNDFLLIAYQDDDRLYLPVDRMGMIQKYMGVDGIAAALDKMGGKTWQRVRSRVKKSVERIAGQLLKIYAERRVKKGHAFGRPDSYFSDFEAAFAYEETEDQVKAIDDVIADMNSETPMDRLVCGDVGYGKTEVALRAAFIAVNDGKQVTLLVPTTVLAQQHYETFRERFQRYPVNVACLSRFRTPAQQKKIVAGLKDGRVDIAIGTHRLLQKDIAFKDLGLIIVDEEQRFGVKHKERLKRFRRVVDVLALTATPIPRTLHMSLMGVRDISIISTPPEHRQAIVTYVSEYDDAIVADAIRKELTRRGQIFFVHNNIATIYSLADKLKKLVPEVNLDVAHGKMAIEDLENVMMAFSSREIDMLVCTTIIESGLDIPNANTMLVNRADRFGLAQIYQLRGRVGRSDEQAYAYLFIPVESVLTADARKRLKVLMEHSDLGAGFQIAMSDLKIRGGGSILGASQSGHIAAVGYDTFLKLMEEAMADLKGDPVREPLDPEINMPLSAHIPEVYIADIDQRLTAYRRLAKITAVSEISDFKSELCDRFGPLPGNVENLLLKMMLRVLAIDAGIRRLELSAGSLSLWFSTLHQKHPYAVVDLVVAQPEKYSLTPDHIFRARLTRGRIYAQVAESKNILKEIAQCVNA
ncbi:MAG: transcription-repair coupling factor [Desulfobacterales bacterium]|nr:transcription-repair coupling factor [Desulfobacterales bacterium]